MLPFQFSLINNKINKKSLFQNQWNMNCVIFIITFYEKSLLLFNQINNIKNQHFLFIYNLINIDTETGAI